MKKTNIVSVDPPPLTVSVLWLLLVYFWPYIMIICVLKRILHKKKSIFMHSSNFNEKKDQKFHICLRDGTDTPRPPLLTVSLTVKCSFFYKSPKQWPKWRFMSASLTGIITSIVNINQSSVFLGGSASLWSAWECAAQHEHALHGLLAEGRPVQSR